MSEPRFSILVVDDEQPQLDALARLIRGRPRVKEVQTANDALEALVKLGRGGYDVVFLDVRKLDLDRSEVAKVLAVFPKAPALVFVSAFDTSAGAAFELRAVDYLMKPVAASRIDDAMTRVEASVARVADVVQARQVDQPGYEQDVIAVRDLRGRAMRLLTRPSILYVKAFGDYVWVYADTGLCLVRTSLSSIEGRFTGHGFLRVHRQYLANLARAAEIRMRANETAVMRFDNGDEIPVSRRRVPHVRRRLQS